MSAHAPGGEPKRTRQALKIDIVVHGRFHAFRLANGLRLLGHDVLVHTNYPKMIAARFGLPADCVREETLRLPQRSDGCQCSRE